MRKGGSHNFHNILEQPSQQVFRSAKTSGGMIRINQWYLTSVAMIGPLSGKFAGSPFGRKVGPKEKKISSNFD
jgi:hypothetical protein